MTSRWNLSGGGLFTQSAFSTAARLTSTVTVLLTMSLAARELSPEEFGLWAILLSIIVLSSVLDIGLRYGLSNRLVALAASQGDEPSRTQEGLFSAVFWCQALIALVGVILCCCLVPCVPWKTLFGIRSEVLAANMDFIVSCSIGSSLLYLPFSLWGAGYYAHQEITTGSVLLGVQSILLLVVFAGALYVLPFHYLVAVYFATYVISGMVLTIFMLRRRTWTIRWNRIADQVRHLRSIAKPSVEFFVLSISATLASTVGSFFTGTVSGLEDAGDYSLLQKLFALLVSLHLAFLVPHAAQYTRRAHLGDWAWIQQNLRMTVRQLWPILFIGGGVIVCGLHPVIIRLWAGQWLSNWTLACLLAMWALATGWTNTFAVLLNSLGLVRIQGMFYLAMVIPVLALPLVLGRLWGMNGVALASFICALPLASVWPAYTAKALTEKRVQI